jgi:5-aminopentanamidase
MARVGYLQFTPEFGDVEGNLGRIEALVDGVDADLIVLPELAVTGYAFADPAELRALAEPGGGAVERRLQALAAARDVNLAVGVAERDGERVYNAAILVGPAGCLGRYRKVHLFQRERELFEPGDVGFPVWDLGFARVGMMVCFDWLFPEAARSLALGGADLIAHPANLVLPHCQGVMPTRCLENRVFAVTANRGGRERRAGQDLTFTGRSQVVAPDGRVLVAEGGSDDQLRVIELDPAAARDKWITPANHALDDRRPQQYRGGGGLEGAP